MIHLRIFLGSVLVVGFCYYLELWWLLITGLAGLLWLGWQRVGLGVVVVMCLALLVISGRIFVFDKATVGSWELVNEEVVGRVCREVDYRRDKIQYTVCTDYGKVLVVGELYPRFEYGDTINVTGKLVDPKPVEAFNYANYLFRFGITKIIYRPQLELINKGNGVGVFLFKFKTFLLDQINQQYHEPFASLIAGLLVGYRGGLSDELLEQFKLTGLTHIIAVSGANVALVVMILERMLMFISKRIRLWLLIAGITVFCIFVGLSASVIRASIMGSLVLLARYFGRDNNVLNVLLLTAAAMALVVPPILAFDAGFQLSFMAVLGIFAFSKKIEQYCSWLNKWPLLKEAMVLTLAAQIGTLPLSLYLFKLLPLHSVIINVVIAPLLPIVIIIAAINLVMWWLFPLGANFLALLVSIGLKTILLMVAMFARLKFFVLDFS